MNFEGSNYIRIAIIGSGPSGFFAAKALLNNSEFNTIVDMFDKLPTPYGLVRWGVAPDHQEIKSITKIFERIAKHPNFNFFGNVDIGINIYRHELLELYDAVIYATGAHESLNISSLGENTRGIYSSTQFFGWYNGHPDFQNINFDLDKTKAAIIGIGNVAIDIARILALTPKDLARTDISETAQKALSKSKIKEIYVIGRRGPIQGAFSHISIRELRSLSDANVLVEPSDLELDDIGVKELKKSHKYALKINELKKAINDNSGNKTKKIRFMFYKSPIDIYKKDNRLYGIKLVKNKLRYNDDGKLYAYPTEEYEKLNIDIVFKSIGFKVTPVPGLPIDQTCNNIPNKYGRIYDPQSEIICKKEYVVGWAKNGAVGAIGANKSESVNTVRLIVEDLKLNDINRGKYKYGALRLLHKRKIPYVTFDSWEILDKYERDKGAINGKPREKITSVDKMLDIIKIRNEYI